MASQKSKNIFIYFLVFWYVSLIVRFIFPCMVDATKFDNVQTDLSSEGLAKGWEAVLHSYHEVCIVSYGLLLP